MKLVVINSLRKMVRKMVFRFICVNWTTIRTQQL